MHTLAKVITTLTILLVDNDSLLSTVWHPFDNYCFLLLDQDINRFFM